MLSRRRDQVQLESRKGALQAQLAVKAAGSPHQLSGKMPVGHLSNIRLLLLLCKVTGTEADRWTIRA